MSAQGVEFAFFSAAMEAERQEAEAAELLEQEVVVTWLSRVALSH